jgi:galactokinase
MTPLEQHTSEFFFARFGQAPELLVQAPGRVNLIGEHTDYNDGFVLPCAIDFGTVVAARRRDDAQIKVFAPDVDDRMDQFAIDPKIPKSIAQPWSNFVRGAVEMLLEHKLEVGGADLVISGNVPAGAGLSSSASLTVAIIEAMRNLYGLVTINPTMVALIAQRVENNFVGVQCGIMDQLASARGQAGAALLIDCRSLEVTAVEMPDDLAVLVVHSGVHRELVDSAYNERRRQCQAAARFFGVSALRDLAMPRLLEGRAGLDDVTFRRARHVVSENQRTLEMALALRSNTGPSIHRIMAESHRSMRDDFEITVPKVDELVDILTAAVGPEGGARMTGGGFGGCAVALVPHDRLPAVVNAVANLYMTPDGHPPKIYECRPSGGAGRIAPER